MKPDIRRTITAGVGCGAGLLAAAAPAQARQADKPQDKARPNIVVFFVDDLGWMDTGCYGSKFYRTPNIDSMAARGMLFTDAYSACTVSSPSRAALMTGKYPARLHITDFISGHVHPWAKLSVPDWTMYLPLEEVTVAEVLKESGYRTWHVGKWHLGKEEMYFPQNQGFDINIGGSGAGAPGLNDACGGYFTPYCRPFLPDGPDGEYLTDRLTDEAVKLIEGNDGTPFYLNMAHYAVHTPLQAKPGTAEKFEEEVDDDYFQQNTVYAAMIESMDESLGRIIAALRENGLYENTVMVFTSDNGALERVSGSRPLRNGKGTEYEGGVRVPMIVTWPGVVTPGSTTHYPVITMDIPTTFMNIVGSSQEYNVDGVSLVPLLEGARPGLRPLFWHYPHYHTQGARPYSAVRLGDWKLIEQLEDGSLELYNLRSDIGESANLASYHPAKRDELHDLLTRWRIETDVQFPTPNPDFDPEKAKKRR